MVRVDYIYKQLKNIADIKDSNGNACLFNGLTILEGARFYYRKDDVYEYGGECSI